MDATTPLLRPIEDAQALLGGIGRTTLYALIKRGELRAVRIGRRTFIAQSELERYVSEVAA